jgi:phycoerythrin-associated linker protein
MYSLNPATVSRSSSKQDRQLVLTQIYHQVLERQPYQSEQKILANLEQDFLAGKVGVRRFVRELGQSQVYLDQFYYRASNAKFLELCFKHFLGRAITNHPEMQVHANILITEGVIGLIASIVGSDEYTRAFGCFTVPHPRLHNCYQSPSAYLESQILNHEHVGQRGLTLPTLYWRELGLNCFAGECRLIDASEMMEPLD